jgi:3-dehydroquinate synthase
MKNKELIRIGNNTSPVFVSEIPDKHFKRLWQLHVGSHTNTTVVVLADKQVYDLHQSWIESFTSRLNITVANTQLLVAGEKIKQLAVAETIINEWIALSIPKNAIILCIGGGTITDLGGFIASVYKRGLRLINIPTSLMAMTDASIGGKNALNLGTYKNQIGTFHAPLFTFVAPEFLKTLPETEMASGYAEMMKHGLLEGKNFLKKMLNIVPNAAAPSTSLLVDSIRIKIQIVDSDPTEKSKRMFLNLGHTFGHAYEGFFATSGQPITHGCAIAWGLTEILFASESICNLHSKKIKDVAAWLNQHYRFDTIPIWEQLKEYIVSDKKNISSSFRIVLLNELGRPFIQAIDENGLKSIHSLFCNKNGLRNLGINN